MIGTTNETALQQQLFYQKSELERFKNAYDKLKWFQFSKKKLCKHRIQKINFQINLLLNKINSKTPLFTYGNN